MTWDTYLIALYLRICKEYKTHLWTVCQRFTTGGIPRCSDEEIIVYLYGLLRSYCELKTIHNYAIDHLRAWFPTLPGYAGFVHRVNRLSEAFHQLLIVLQDTPQDDEEVYLLDSFGIAHAHS